MTYEERLREIAQYDFYGAPVRCQDADYRWTRRHDLDRCPTCTTTRLWNAHIDRLRLIYKPFPVCRIYGQSLPAAGVVTIPEDTEEPRPSVYYDYGVLTGDNE